MSLLLDMLFRRECERVAPAGDASLDRVVDRERERDLELERDREVKRLLEWGWGVPMSLAPSMTWRWRGEALQSS